MADENEGRTLSAEFTFEPFDGRQIQVVGRLVEQQNVGAVAENAGERGTARLAAGEAGRVLGTGQAEFVSIVPVTHAGASATRDRLQEAAENEIVRLRPAVPIGYLDKEMGQPRS